MKQRVCQWSANAFVKENEHEGGIGPASGETIAVAPADAFEQAWD